MEWQPIETAPLNQAVIVSYNGMPGEAHYVHEHGWYWAGNDPSDSWGGQIYPSHWMPLPEPPDQSGESHGG